MSMYIPAVRRTGESADFFDMAAEGRLLLRQCAKCRTFRGPQEPVCPACFEMDHEVQPASGRATLLSWSVVYRSPVKGLESPYVAGLVEVEEGPWVLTRVCLAPGAGPSMGMALEIFGARGDDDGEVIILTRSPRAQDPDVRTEGNAMEVRTPHLSADTGMEEWTA